MHDLAGTLSASLATGERRALVERLRSSRSFETSARLRDLLVYLAERSERSDPIREQEIGVAVFGRLEGYDTSHDTLVRVQISHLRKKLQQYFEDEGRHESWDIVIPKGNYALVFRPVSLDGDVPEPGIEIAEPVEPAVIAPAPAMVSPLLIAAAILCIVLLGLGWAYQRAQAPPVPGRPVAVQLWRDMFANGQSTYLVLADANLIEFENIIGHQFTAAEYDTRNFDAIATARIPDPEKRQLALTALRRPMTSVVDAQAAQRLVLLAADAGARLEIVGARDMSLRHIAAQNTILLGSRRADPWVSLFEDRLNFQTQFEEGPPRVARFVNRKPMPGEQAEYFVQWGKEGYCRVAYLPNPKASGVTLLLSGTDLYSSESGGDFITREDCVRQLRSKFDLKPGEKMPPFEVLLHTRVVASAAPDFEVVAWRRY